MGHFCQPIACTEIFLDTTEAPNNKPFPSPISVPVQLLEVSAKLAGRVNQLGSGFYEHMYSYCTRCWTQNTWPSGEVQPRNPPSPGPGYLDSLDSSPIHTTRSYPQYPTGRKRRRPRLHSRPSNEYMPSERSDKAGVCRSAHNRVEQKYREGLNAKIKRFQRMVSTIRQHNGRDKKILGQSRLKQSHGLDRRHGVHQEKKIETERDAALK